MSNTLSARNSPLVGAPFSACQAKTPRATRTTPGTNQAETRSAARWILGCRSRASSSIRSTRASAVSWPTPSARSHNAPSRLTDPASRRSPSRTSRGRASPVMLDSSIRLAPSITRPSTGTASPARTRTSSSRARSAESISSASPPRRTQARRGTEASSAPAAPEARRFAPASRYWPSVTITSTIAAVSKYRLPCPRTVWITLSVKAAPTPMQISRFASTRPRNRVWAPMGVRIRSTASPASGKPRLTTTTEQRNISKYAKRAKSGR